jgi:sterol desaturase/sphingolipid hydroxylase (fatty acid hydroxylase superfamily)
MKTIDKLSLLKSYLAELWLFPLIFSFIIYFLFSITSWVHLREFFSNYSDKIFFVFGTMILHEIIFIFMNSFFILIEYFNIFQEHKIKRNERLNSKDFTHVLLDFFINHFVFQPVVLWFSFDVNIYFGMQMNQLPTFLTLFFHLCLCFLWYDFTFYFLHRFLHSSKFLYENIHKKHHYFVNSISLSTEYLHLIEDFLL